MIRKIYLDDFATANVKAGTGGVDASIGFETLRPENSGSAMNDSLAFFAPFVNAHVSSESMSILVSPLLSHYSTVSDLIALSVVMSVGSCSAPIISIPLRGGRIDALHAGPFGVPQPETDIKTTLDQFVLAGFDQSDAIVRVLSQIQFLV